MQKFGVIDLIIHLILLLKSLMLQLVLIRKLILEDIDCSIAHAKMLGKTKVLSSSESLQIINGLETIKVDFLEGKFSPESSI